jgi:hypothetical protein
MPLHGFRKANRLSCSTCDPCSQGQMCSFDLLGGLVPSDMVLWCEVSLVGTPVIRRNTGHAQWREQRRHLSEHLSCRGSQHGRQHRTAVMITGMPQPPLAPLATDNTPHVVHRSFVGLVSVHADLCRGEPSEGRMMHGVDVTAFFFRWQCPWWGSYRAPVPYRDDHGHARPSRRGVV